MIEYSKNDQAKQIATNLISEFHKDIEAARIEYLFTDQNLKVKGHQVWAKVSVANALLNHFMAINFVMIFPVEVWKHLNDKQKTAVIDHELSHCVQVDNDEGDITWGIRGHDLEEFSDIIVRHGLWRPDLKEFAEAVQLKMKLTG